jgi:hypothetical protein
MADILQLVALNTRMLERILQKTDAATQDEGFLAEIFSGCLGGWWCKK